MWDLTCILYIVSGAAGFSEREVKEEVKVQVSLRWSETVI